METTLIYPVITLYQPWATWIMREWKTIETRTHDRFKSLKGRHVLIHSGKTTDAQAAINPYLTREQILQAPSEMVNGFILGLVFVDNFRELLPADSKAALIECNTKRFGLELSHVQKFNTPIPEKGEMGIWYYDLENKIKVKKS